MMIRMIRALQLIVLVTALVTFACMPASGQIMSVSIPKLSLGKGERIVGFELHIRSGRIALLPNIPIGWNMSVNNDPSWQTVVKGSIEVGGAAAGADFLQDFMVIEKEPGTSSDSPFDLCGEVVVTSDFKHERHIKLAMKDFTTKGAGADDSSKKPN
jgi:hypothetical protein